MMAPAVELKRLADLSPAVREQVLRELRPAAVSAAAKGWLRWELDQSAASADRRLGVRLTPAEKQMILGAARRGSQRETYGALSAHAGTKSICDATAYSCWRSPRFSALAVGENLPTQRACTDAATPTSNTTDEPVRRLSEPWGAA
jgi:hypothetical protein